MTTALVGRAEFKKRVGILSTRFFREIRESVGKCENCGVTEELTCHHIHRVKHNGSDFADNLVVLCCACHQALHSIEEANKLRRGNERDKV